MQVPDVFISNLSNQTFSSFEVNGKRTQSKEPGSTLNDFYYWANIIRFGKVIFSKNEALYQNSGC